MLAGMRRQITAAYPPKPKFTEANVPDLTGKVYIVTGSNTGIGMQLARILHSKNAKVYIAARDQAKAEAAAESIKASNPSSAGSLAFLRLDLADLTTIKASVDEFLSKEKQLHVLFNNAGVMMPPQRSKTAQGYELQLGINNVGTFLFTRLLTPILTTTAAASSPGSVRVVWVSSSMAEIASPSPGGVPLDKLDDLASNDSISPRVKYGISKAGNYLHATEYARRFGDKGIVSVALNPGNLRSDLARHLNSLQKAFLNYFVQHPTVNGAYTELFAGLSPEVGLDKNGAWIQPWGRFEQIRDDLEKATKPESEGGSGIAQKFWEWTEKQVQQYL
ncbi:hypothetical protein PpBr36_02758 [Pyricularia pennisetigena]|uniref:hypothetical protein n=1 Tax=Pyricularia pennisetigena TaxID=1578925 RepID=UPI00114D96FF|nr:hypothetical protein PpBr36_02758 [Pyricularia pennisetigena]TLS30649.1 hypothetical protein PpBr36_02758 [Pyricularia pennisetigena]